MWKSTQKSASIKRSRRERKRFWCNLNLTASKLAGSAHTLFWRRPRRTSRRRSRAGSLSSRSGCMWNRHCISRIRCLTRRSTNCRSLRRGISVKKCPYRWTKKADTSTTLKVNQNSKTRSLLKHRWPPALAAARSNRSSNERRKLSSPNGCPSRPLRH